MSDQETRAIEERIIEATHPEGPWEWGHYIERNDRGTWVPLIHGEKTEEEAQSAHMKHYLHGAREEDIFRNSRVVRRATSPWEIQ